MVNKEAARDIVATINGAKSALDEAIERLRTRVSAQAADACHMNLVDVNVKLGFHLLSPIFEEFPDLEPPLPEGATTFSPYSVPEKELAPVREALARLKTVMHELIPVFQEAASTPGEERGYLTALAMIRASIEETDTRLSELAPGFYPDRKQA